MSIRAMTPEVGVECGVTVVALGPGFQSLDEQVLDSGLRDSLLEIADEAHPPLVVLDVSHTTFFGSSFIEIVFRMWNRLRGQPGGNLALCSVTPYCREVLQVAHLDTLWRMYPTRAEAVAALSSGAS